MINNGDPQMDFMMPLEDMIQDCLKTDWGNENPDITPKVSTDPPYDYSNKIRFGDFEYDYFSTYYIRVREGDTEIDNELPAEGGNFYMKTPINIDLTARRLKYGEHFEELNNMRLEVIRILGMCESDKIPGIHKIEIDRPGERDIESRNFETAGRAPRTIWYLRITGICHYMKGYSCA